LTEVSQQWILDPTWVDDNYVRRGESITDWLARTTTPGAKECRRFLKENHLSLSKSPTP
jgi:hypothetical protein